MREVLNRSLFYAGIGSRKTPPEVLKIFVYISGYLAQKGFTLRSGRAPGADQAFEEGCDEYDGKKEIYLPWRHFEGSKSKLIVQDSGAFKVAERFYHSDWNNLSSPVKKLMARNSHQILGWDLHSPSAFVLCWTKNGSGRGGTGQAIRIAERFAIPVFDAGKYDLQDIESNIKKFVQKFLWWE